MSKVVIKGPNADEIFNRFKQKADRKRLEKHYGIKKAAFNIDNVTAAEYVTAVNKHAVFFFLVDVNIKPEGKTEIRKGGYKDIEKVKFYDFTGRVSKSEWKESNTVPMYKSLKVGKCSKCGGDGKKTCKDCQGSGLVTCSKCKGTGQVKCDRCNGTGKIRFSVTILDNKGKKKEKKEIIIQCPDCFGTGKLRCPSCHGTKKVTCKNCNGTGGVPCDDCYGTGNIWTYEIAPVPFKEQNDTIPVVVPSIKTNMEKQMGKDITALIEKVNGILIKSTKDLNKKVIEPNLGYYTKNIDKALSQTLKLIKKYGSMAGHKVRMPIYLFPLIVLDCKTPKGKMYNVYSIGSDRGFLVLGQLP
ncbi:MAG: hypothetical protein ACTSU2_14840 [Promethearchaeota archaeon]